MIRAMSAADFQRIALAPRVKEQSHTEEYKQTDRMRWEFDVRASQTALFRVTACHRRIHGGHYAPLALLPIAFNAYLHFGNVRNRHS